MSRHRSLLSADGLRPRAGSPSNLADLLLPQLTRALPVLAFSVACFLAARLDAALQLPALRVPVLPVLPVSGAILLAVLLLTTPRRWWAYLLAALAGLLAAGVTATDAALSRLLGAYLCNGGVSLACAFAIRTLAPAPCRFDRLRPLAVLLICGGIAGPGIAVLLTAAFGALNASADPVLAALSAGLLRSFWILALVPLIVHHVRLLLTTTFNVHALRAAEACLLLIALVVTGATAALSQASDAGSASMLLYSPLPVLIWAAVRFGVAGTCASMLLLGLIAIWATATGSGSFTPAVLAYRELSLILFLVATCTPLLLLAAALQERTAVALDAAMNEARFESLFALDAVPTVIWRADATVVAANAAFRRLTGYDRDDLDARSLRLSDLVAGGDGHRTEDLSESGIPKPEWGPQEVELRAKDGRRLPAIAGSRPLPASDHEGIAYFLDLSASKRAATAHRESQLLHEAVLASLHDQIVVLNRDGLIIAANESWRRMVEPATIAPTERLQVGDHYLTAFARTSENSIVRELLDGVRNVLAGLNARHRLEFSVDSADGPVWFEISIEPLRRPEGGAVVTRTAITERKRAMTQAMEQRQQLAHLSRAAVLGELSGAFAHELTQPLTSILGNADAALQLLTQESANLAEIREIMRDIIRDDIRAAEVIQRLRSMLTRGTINREPIDLNLVVRDTLGLARSELMTRNVAVDTSLDAESPPVLADRIQMQQVVLNLVVNACEAMSGIRLEERRLTIATQYDPTTRVIECSVRDNGHGIPDGNLERIFQPFVSTKQQGLGLGLAICRSIIEAHGGRLWAERPPGRGALLRFTARVDA